MHFQSAYLKLTLYYVLAAMAISIFFSVLIFNISSAEINRGLGRQVGSFRNFKEYRDALPILEQLRMEQVEESNQRLTKNLIYFNLLILVLSTVAGYAMAKKTLHPIEKAVDAQNRFTADASHELRTPLTAMRTEIEVNLRDKNLTLAESKELLKSNLEEIERLENLSNALLKLAHIKEESRAHFKPVDLINPIKEAVSKVSSLADKKNITVKINAPKTIKVSGDKHSLTELFVILIDNAIKYSPENSQILLTLNHDKKDAYIIVKDEGAGIKATDLPYIFNRFFRADASRTKIDTSGYGLGLSIAESIALLHRGTIEVSSKPGKGSEFSVVIPLKSTFH